MSSSSVHNRLVKDSLSKDHPEHEESSGWTYYLKDFSCTYYKEDSFISTSPSLVSDAAWNGPDHIHTNHVKKLSFKNLNKSSNIPKYDDAEDLEDTASSPVNSPKVCHLKHMKVNNTGVDDAANPTGDVPVNHTRLNHLSSHEDEKTIKVVDARNVNEYVDLKKKGLCLVPMSALINYFG